MLEKLRDTLRYIFLLSNMINLNVLRYPLSKETLDTSINIRLL